jgi:hypothetical protein
MCTHIADSITVSGSAKGPDGWFPLGLAVASVDHPQHASAAHTLNLDFYGRLGTAGSRLAVELDPESARRLVQAIEAALAEAAPVI